MLSGCWVPVLLLLLLLPAVTEAQSGDGETDMEPRLSCTSHIMLNSENSVTCQLVGGRSDSEDDEDDEADGIERMTACILWGMMGCIESFGNTIHSKHLLTVGDYNVTAHLKRGGQISTMINLNKIVKPRSPKVFNVTFDQESNQAFIYIHTPYHNDYLQVKNQLFQLHIWSTSSSMYQNITSSDHAILRINMELLQSNAEYQVKVRAIPKSHLQGSWSDWSETFSFSTAAADSDSEHTGETYTLIVCLVLLAVVTSSVVLFWKNKILTFMWPSIPHPKHTLVQICKPNKGLLLNFKPEVFSALKVYPMEKTEEAEPSITAAAAAAEDSRSDPASSTHSSDSSRSATSASTEELELSALLSSSEGEDGLQSSSPSPVHVAQPEERRRSPQPESSGGGGEAEESGGGQQDEAYVTMSSFYQIK